MSKSPPGTRKDRDTEQLERFKKTAREQEVDESPGAFERSFNRILPTVKSPPEK